MEILRQKIDEVSYPMGEDKQYVDESKEHFKCVFSEGFLFFRKGFREQTVEEPKR